MWIRKDFLNLKSSRYYNTYKFVPDYAERSDLAVFVMMIENIDINLIRFSEKKELLKVLEYIFEKYRLYKVKSSYLNWFYFINKYCPFLVSEREYIVLEYILRLKEQLWWYYMNYYNIYFNIALDYIGKYKRYNFYHNKLHGLKDKPFDKTMPNFNNFPSDYDFNKKGFINKDYFKTLSK